MRKAPSQKVGLMAWKIFSQPLFDFPGGHPGPPGTSPPMTSLGCSSLPHVGRCGAQRDAVSHDGASVPRWDTRGHTGVEPATACDITVDPLRE